MRCETHKGSLLETHNHEVSASIGISAKLMAARAPSCRASPKVSIRILASRLLGNMFLLSLKEVFRLREQFNMWKYEHLILQATPSGAHHQSAAFSDARYHGIRAGRENLQLTVSQVAPTHCPLATQNRQYEVSVSFPPSAFWTG